ncbi:YktB family protein [Bacillus horti]|uniref:UPF0637 protein J2S11_002850 n=1 Tax=Caldalkalibacillus horti TaxID=77523 RepID=A0ABT9W124_9BACI|nr:DUF1054 domain-containing protein [Bacillus horti]MDQ0166934.1 uncharacterized protein YktB (UPF0637 family) [Bacillus horti]
MTFTGFTQQDFDVFHIEGLDERMAALIKLIRPKLEELGTRLQKPLSELVGEEMFPHVAKHARRTVNPPNDTWVAWANNKRGYKQHPHFQVGMWESHLFVWFALIYECPTKQDFAKVALKEAATIYKQIPDSFVWSIDHMRPEAIPQSELKQKDVKEMLIRLRDVKKAELLCGIHIDRHDPILTDGAALEDKILDTFEQLSALYKLSLRVRV